MTIPYETWIDGFRIGFYFLGGYGVAWFVARIYATIFRPETYSE